MRLIDADDLTDRLLQNINKHSICTDCLDCWYEILTDIEIQPTIDPIRYGKWEDKSDIDIYMEQLYRCSYCKEEFYLEEGTPKENNYNYCPNCGTKMEAR